MDAFFQAARGEMEGPFLLVDFVKKIVPVNDDIFDFFYEAMPGYEEVVLRRTLLTCWAASQDPRCG